MEHADLRVALLHRGHLGALRAQRGGVEPLHHRQPWAVVGDRAVLVAARRARRHHLLERGAAVGPRGVHLQVAAQLLDAHELGQRARRGGLDLALVLAQLGRHPGEAERGVDLFFARAGDPLAGAFRPRATDPAAEQSPLRQLPAALDGAGAQRHVVRLAAGQVDPRRAEALRRHDAQVDLHAAAQQDGGAGVAGALDARRAMPAGEGGDDARRVARRNEHVEVADRLDAAAEAPRRLGAHDAGHAAQVGEEVGEDRLRLRQQDPAAGLPLLGERGQEARLRRLAEAGQLGELARRRRGLELGQGGDAQAVPDDPRPLRPQPRQPHQLEERRRRVLLQRLEPRQVSGLDQLADAGADLLADAGQLGRIAALRQQLRHRQRVPLDRARGTAEGAHLERVLALDLQEVGKAVEGVGDLEVGEHLRTLRADQSREPAGERRRHRAGPRPWGPAW